MKKKNIIITSCVSGALVLAITLCAILLPKNKIKTENKDKDTQSNITSDLNIEDIKDDDNDNTSSGDVVVVRPDEPNVDLGGGANETSSKEKAPDPAQPVKPTPKPIPQGNTEQGNTSSESAYFCGNPKHHCQNEAQHRGMIREEERGCFYCGSHDCPSLYCVDEWGGCLG